jgi:electron transfer flavoprotein alpha/beta subunit
MKDFLIEILDYNENVLRTETLINTTKDKAVELAVQLCEKTDYSYCFNLEEHTNENA